MTPNGILKQDYLGFDQQEDESPLMKALRKKRESMLRDLKMKAEQLQGGFDKDGNRKS